MIDIYRIKWGNEFNDNYPYGSLISKQGTEVTYENPLQSPGKKIHSWFSKRRFVYSHLAPNLPILVPGQSYRAQFNLRQKPAKTINVQLEFFDIHDERIKEEFFEEKSFVFKYPKDAVSYQMHLVNLNNKELVFLDFWLSPVDYETTWSSKQIGLPSHNGLYIARRSDFTNWQVTLVDDEPDTVTLPLQTDVNNVIILIGKTILSQEDIEQIKLNLQQEGIDLAAIKKIESFGISNRLTQAKEALVDGISN